MVMMVMYLCCGVIEDGQVSWASVDEDKLINYLFVEKEYNKLIRPVKNRFETLNVSFEMALIQLITLVSTQTD